MGSHIKVDEDRLCLSTGERVWVMQFHLTPTYPGLLEGSPTPEMNRMAVQRAKALLETHLYGPPPVVINAPDEENPSTSRRLPPKSYCVQLDSPRLLPGGSCGSCLNVIWFDHDRSDVSLHANLESIMAGIDWDRAAVGYDI